MPHLNCGEDGRQRHARQVKVQVAIQATLLEQEELLDVEDHVDVEQSLGIPSIGTVPHACGMRSIAWPKTYNIPDSGAQVKTRRSTQNMKEPPVTVVTLHALHAEADAL